MSRVYIWLFLCCIGTCYAQTPAEKEWIKSHYDLDRLERIIDSLDGMKAAQKEHLRKQASKYGWLDSFVDEEGNYSELVSVMNDTIPVYYTTYSAEAAETTRTNFLHTGGALGLELDGQDMYLAFWDHLLARVSHQEFGGRVVAGDNIINTSNHASHVGGIIFSEGIDIDAKGMAPLATGTSYYWDDDLFEIIVEGAAGLLVSNHSYGLDPYDVPDVYIGDYTQLAKDWDFRAHNAPYLLMVFAAGNSGDDNIGFDDINDDPMPGAGDIYDKLVGQATAKNVLTVANAEDATILNGNLFFTAVHPSSSPGPTDDLRIKPDIAGNGDMVYSLGDDNDTDYWFESGTSMAAPNVSGTLLLLQQHCRNLTGVFMRAATLKGLALHTADDIDPAGPDAFSGWGLLNAHQAAIVMNENGAHSIIEERQLESNDVYTFDVLSDGINPLSVSLSWCDWEGPVNNGPPSNNTTPVLVNNLNLRVLQGTNVFSPFLLTSPSTFTTGVNNVDPYERVDIDLPSGIYTIEVTHSGSLYYNVPQDYSLIVTGIALCSTEDEDIVITAPVITGDEDHRHVSGNVVATNTIAADADAHYRAGESIQMNPGFFADSTSMYWAEIGTCDGTFEPDFEGNGFRRPMPQSTAQHSEDIIPMRIYPNPADTSVTIVLEEDTIARIILSSMDGKPVFDRQASGISQKIDVSSLQAGLYIVTVESVSGKKYNEKLILN